MRTSGQILLVLLSTALLFSCGSKKKTAAGGGEQAGNGAVVDCATFDKKIAECSDAFIAEYVTTKTGVRANGDTLAAKTKSMNFAFGMISSKGESLCTNEFVFHNLSLRTDAGWVARFNKCDTSASCDVWAKCTAHAIGNPLEID